MFYSSVARPDEAALLYLIIRIKEGFQNQHVKLMIFLWKKMWHVKWNLWEKGLTVKQPPKEKIYFIIVVRVNINKLDDLNAL